MTPAVKLTKSDADRTGFKITNPDPSELYSQARSVRSRANEAATRADRLKRDAHRDEAEMLIADDRALIGLTLEIDRLHADRDEQTDLAASLTAEADQLENDAQSRSFDLGREASDRDREASRIAISHDDYAAQALSREADELRRRANGH